MVCINSKLYFKAFSGKWLGSLAVYAKLQQIHTSKVFYYKKCQKTKVLKDIAGEIGIKPSTFHKHLAVLKANNLIFQGENYLRLASQKEINQWNYTIKFVAIPENIKTLKEIKTFLIGIPILSNLFAQKKAIEKKNTRLTIKGQAESDKFIQGMNSKDRRMAIKREIKINRDLILTNQSICNKLGKKSKSTATKYKRQLKNLGCYSTFNEVIIIKSSNYESYLYQKEDGKFSDCTFLLNRSSIVKYMPTKFFLSSYRRNKTYSPLVKNKKIEKNAL